MNTHPLTHPSGDELAAYVIAALEVRQAARLERHVAACAPCAARLQAEAAAETVLQELWPVVERPLAEVVPLRRRPGPAADGPGLVPAPRPEPATARLPAEGGVAVGAGLVGGGPAFRATLTAALTARAAPAATFSVAAALALFVGVGSAVSTRDGAHASFGSPRDSVHASVHALSAAATAGPPIAFDAPSSSACREPSNDLFTAAGCTFTALHGSPARANACAYSDGLCAFADARSVDPGP